MFSQFVNPPAEYGEVAFYWWVGEPLTRERLEYQLEQLKNHHICALQINYCHGNKGGLSFGLTMESDPALFTDEWWELVHWFVEQCKACGICVSLSDYTLGIGQGYYMDDILREVPDLCGQYLALEDGEVIVKRKENSVNPLDKRLGPAVIRHFFDVFEQHFPGECGKALNFFFSDELSFHIRGWLWHPEVPGEFLRLKGYDVTPYLRGLFEDIGDITPKIRLDYADVLVQMEEDAYFIPIYEWHQQRGMTYGCDHGGRGRDITEFGDYFRTQRWNQGPGNDQPGLRSDIVKNKVASSISHLYHRPRTWLEGYYGSGWGTSSAEVADATFRNFCMGHNLLTLHGLYYTTYGAMWEWAPPCNHFRMPYWKHMDRFLLCVKRLSWLMCQGTHVADAAILYPVAAVEGGVDGEAAVKCCFEAAEQLYDHGIDFDFMDFQSLERAEVEFDMDGNAVLRVAAKDYRALVIPSMKTIRFSSLTKAAAFSRAGGLVVFVGNLPVASDRIGRNDGELDALVAWFAEKEKPPSHASDLPAWLREHMVTDFACENNLYQDSTPRDPRERTDGLNCRCGYFQHRTIDGKKVYFLYGIGRGSQCAVRAVGACHVLNPWTAEESPFEPLEVTSDGLTRFLYPLEHSEMLILVVDPTQQPCLGQTKQLVQAEVIQLPEEWNCELLPTMDNTYGDFVQPPSGGCLGPRCVGGWFMCEGQARTYHSIGYESHFQQYGPFQEPLGHEISLLGCRPVSVQDKTYSPKPYAFSLRYGAEDDPGPQDSYHGNKGKISDEFLCMGQKRVTNAGSDSQYLPEEEGTWYYFVTYVDLPMAASVWVREGSMKANHIFVGDTLWKSEKPARESDLTGRISLPAGITRIVLEYASAGRTYFVLDKEESLPTIQYPLSSRWYRRASIIPLLDEPDALNHKRLFQTTTPPGARAAIIRADVMPRAFINHQSLTVCETSDGHFRCELPDKETVRGTQLILEWDNPCGTNGFEWIEYSCGEGVIRLGDWGATEGLRTFSGGIRYKQTLMWQHTQAAEKVILNLGEVGCSAEVRVNGISKGIRLTPPYQFDISTALHDGLNCLEIEIYNTLYNHFLSVPNYYNSRKQPSGLIGPVLITRYEQ